MASPAAAHRDAGSPAPQLTVLGAVRRPKIFIREVLAGLVVGLALIPEAIAFSIIVGVDPRVGLFSSFVMAVTIAFTGGRPAMITGATAAVSLVVAPLAREHGMDYLIATVILAGALQIVFALVGVAKLMRFIPRSVMVGFINSLAIMIFISQLPHLIGVTWVVYPLVAAGIGIMVLMPKITKVIPAPLVSIVLVTAAVIVFSISVPTVGDQGELPRSLPELFIPQVPLTWETLVIIAPVAAAMALVGLIESLMTAKLVDEITDTHSSKTREAWGQGVANALSGLFGGMGGCAMVGQTMVNVKGSGARTRLSTFFAGVFLLVLVVVFGDFVAIIPMAALVAVMIMVSVGSFDWHSVRLQTLRRLPKTETFVMVFTVATVLITHNLAIGVIGGVIVASVLFVRRVAHFVSVDRTIVEQSDRTVVTYRVTGELFFASSNDLTTLFAYASDPPDVVIDMTQAHIWDASAVASLDAIVTKYEQRGAAVELIGMNRFTSAFHSRLTGGLGSSL